MQESILPALSWFWNMVFSCKCQKTLMKAPHLLPLEIITTLEVGPSGLPPARQAGESLQPHKRLSSSGGRQDAADPETPLQLGGQMGSCSSSRPSIHLGGQAASCNPQSPHPSLWAGRLLPPPHRCPAAPRRRGLPIALSSLLHRFKRVVFGDCAAKRALNFQRQPFQSLL